VANLMSADSGISIPVPRSDAGSSSWLTSVLASRRLKRQARPVRLRSAETVLFQSSRTPCEIDFQSGCSGWQIKPCSSRNGQAICWAGVWPRCTSQLQQGRTPAALEIENGSSPPDGAGISRAPTRASWTAGSFLQHPASQRRRLARRQSRDVRRMGSADCEFRDRAAFEPASCHLRSGKRCQEQQIRLDGGRSQ
jgi:hypothetical protein